MHFPPLTLKLGSGLLGIYIVFVFTKWEWAYKCENTSSLANHKSDFQMSLAITWPFYCIFSNWHQQHSVFTVFWGTKTAFQIFPTVSQNTLELRFTTTTKIHWSLVLGQPQYLDQIIAVSQSLSGRQGQTFKKALQQRIQSAPLNRKLFHIYVF